jgi:drug/metabolite transporter (DMT)-like permease
MWTLVIPYLAWLLVRHRPGISYLTVVIVVANGVLAAVLFREYAQMPLALILSAGALSAASWSARYLAATRENQGLRR